MGDKWFLDYGNATELGQKLMQAIVDRNKHPVNSTSYTTKSLSIGKSMHSFDQALTTLQQVLSQSALRRQTTDREAERRQALIDQLLTKQKQINLAFNNNDSHHSTQRSALLTGTNPFAEDDPWSDNYAAGGASGVDSNMSIDHLRQQQQRVIEEQDRGLDALAKIVGRQKEIAVQIGNEVESQNDLIDDIHDHVDSTHVRLLRETEHVRVIDRKSNACCERGYLVRDSMFDGQPVEGTEEWLSVCSSWLLQNQSSHRILQPLKFHDR